MRINKVMLLGIILLVVSSDMVLNVASDNSIIPEGCQIFFIDNKIYDRPACYLKCLAKFTDGKVYAEIDPRKGCKCIDCTLLK
ncbi:unnamed protein product [Urochloa decumbens]|uniref:Uncharacterized protein n=1 Tax=Urochloa decumbens TaxID=240449 RepID=A0ABC9DHH3_9POAL